MLHGFSPLSFSSFPWCWKNMVIIPRSQHLTQQCPISFLSDFPSLMLSKVFHPLLNIRPLDSLPFLLNIKLPPMLSRVLALFLTYWYLIKKLMANFPFLNGDDLTFLVDYVNPFLNSYVSTTQVFLPSIKLLHFIEHNPFMLGHVKIFCVD
jgi:hypothetical protein